MFGVKCDHIQITKSKKTLAIYEQYWNQIMNLIGDKSSASFSSKFLIYLSLQT